MDNDYYIDQSKDVLNSILNDGVSTNSDGEVDHVTMLARCLKSD